MANVKKANRVQDTDIKRLNHVGLGLKAIAQILGCHPATITLRLNDMGIEPTDTRRSFMEEVFRSLSNEEQDWLSNNLFNAGIGIKEFVTTLIREAYAATPTVAAATPAPMPVMESVVAAEPVKDTVEAKPVESEPVKSPEPVAAADVQVKPEKVSDVLPAETEAPAPAAPTKSLFGGSGS